MDLDLKPVPPKPPKPFPWGLAFGFSAVLMAVVGAAMFAPMATGSPEQRAVVKHIKANVGNPESVEVIDFSGPRNVADKGDPPIWCYRIKYRAENEVGGMGVWVRLYRFLPDGSAERVGFAYERWVEHVGWEKMPGK